jgi:MscS family membrane protein
MTFEKILEQTLWQNTIKQYMWFAAILLFGLIFLRIFSRFFSNLFFKFFQKFSSEVKAEKFIELLLKPVELALLVNIIYISLNQLSHPFDELFIKRKTFEISYQDVLDKLYLFFFIISIQWMVLRLIDFIALVYAYKASLTESKSDDQLVPFLRELAKIIAIVIGIFVMLGMVFKINVLTLIAGLGIGGIAIALAAKDSLENLFGSFTIFLDKPFVVGDLINVDGVEGTIEKVGFRSTQIRSLNQSVVTIPNKKMIDDVLENLTRRNVRRVRFTIGINYETNASVLKNIVKEIHEYILGHSQTNEDVIVAFDEFGTYAQNILILYYVHMIEFNEHLQVKEEINYKIAEIIEKHGAHFAYPTQKIIQ